MSKSLPNSVAELTDQLRTVGYLSDRGLSTALHISLQLGRPCFLKAKSEWVKQNSLKFSRNFSIDV